MAHVPVFGRSTADGSEHDAHPVLITAAAASFDEQQHARIRKYTILMGIRIPALILAAVAYSTLGSPWVALAIIGLSIPLPWIAVLIANDRPPRSKDEMRRYDRPRGDRTAIEGPHRTIEN